MARRQNNPVVMCKGQDCPFRSECYRYVRVPWEKNPTYLSTTPFESKDQDSWCVFYMSKARGQRHDEKAKGAEE